ncbi:MAG: hypothetical protein JW953_11750 [Anaerolineae bacterium]|nr:hypothetical protein [Anaerolineae bacterium]
MANAQVLILEGSNGQSFFFKETLLANELVEQVDVVSWADEAIELIRHSVYDLIVINLVEAWEQGMRLGLWLSQRPTYCTVLLIISSELERPLPANGSFAILAEPFSLRNFVDTVHTIIQSGIGGHSPNAQNRSNNLSGLPAWSGGPLHEEYAGYWSPFAQLF